MSIFIHLFVKKNFNSWERYISKIHYCIISTHPGTLGTNLLCSFILQPNTSLSHMFTRSSKINLTVEVGCILSDISTVLTKLNSIVLEQYLPRLSQWYASVLDDEARDSSHMRVAILAAGGKSYSPLATKLRIIFTCVNKLSFRSPSMGINSNFPAPHLLLNFWNTYWFTEIDT